MTLLYKNKILLYSFIFLLGFLSSFGLPPYNFFYVNFFSYPALLWILLFYSKDKASSFYIGWIFGFGYFISNLYWITNSLTFEDIFRPLIPFALILVPLFLALFYGLSTLLFSLTNPKKNILSIGLGFSFQKTKCVPTNKYDKKLNYILTEREVL